MLSFVLAMVAGFGFAASWSKLIPLYILFQYNFLSTPVCVATAEDVSFYPVVYLIFAWNKYF